MLDRLKSLLFPKGGRRGTRRDTRRECQFGARYVEALEHRQLLSVDPVINPTADVADPLPVAVSFAATENIQDSWTAESTPTLSVSTNTGEKPQSKLWTHDGDWFAVLPNSTGTWIWRLDGSNWTPLLQLSTSSGIHADVKAVGDVTHVLLFAGGSSQLASVQYVAATRSYEYWSERPGNVDISLPGSTETATIDVDSTGRLWLAYDNKSAHTAEVRYSDGAYSSWSGPIVVASGLKTDDITDIIAMPTGQIGVFWSNQNAKRFGFRTHDDGATATDWNTAEVPADQSALGVGTGMADDHLNMAVASDGTLYVAVKTSYDNSKYPEIGLLVRRPDGSWDPLYRVDGVGTRPIVLLNEPLNRVIVAYSEQDGGGKILYCESPADQISLSAPQTLISGNHNNVTSTKQNFTGELLVVASSGSKVDGTLLVGPTGGPTVPTNQPPAVSAGPDLTAQLGTPATLAGVVSDDGQPSGSLSSLWSLVSGPGLAIFGNQDLASTNVTFSAAGTYVLRLTASDGELSASDDVTVVVTDVPSANQPPTVNAGADATVAAGSMLALSGVASDDGQPSGSLTTQWSVVSGPGSVTFGSASALATSAVFSAAGSYVLRLTASDGALSAADDVSITVSTPPAAPSPGVVGYWSFDRTAAGTQESTTSASLLLSEDAGSLQGGASIGTGHTGSGLIISGANQRYVVPDSPGLEISQSITIAAWIKPESRGTQYVVKKAGHSATDGFELSLSNKGKVFVRFNETSSGNTYRVDSSSNYPTGGNTWMHVVATYDGSTIRLYINGQEQGSKAIKFTIAKNDLPLSIGAGADGYRAMPGAIDDVLIADRALSASEVSQLYQGTFNPDPAPVNQAPSVTAGSDRTTQVGTPITLDGWATDDGLPNGSLTTQWNLVSGPGSPSFGSSNSTVTTVNFNTAGTYVLRLTASDGTLSSSDDVTVVVNPIPVNQAPTVNAGPDRSAQVGSAISLSGSVTDDGLPSGSVSIQWSVVSGPGSVVFGNSTAASTSASFAAVGTYVLRLTANDGALGSSDDVVVTVAPASPVNQPPSVSAGADKAGQTGSAIALSGTATDDGQPSGILLTQWTQVSGPGTVQFANSNSPTTTATFNTAGTYVLRLTASDGALSSSDDMIVTVSPAPPVNQPPTVSAGPDVAATVGAPITLNGSASDDGLPSGNLTLTWSRVSGPGTVFFGSSGAATSTATFSAAGTYVLRLTGSDGVLSASDDVVVTVAAAPVNGPPSVSAGPDVAATVGTPITLNGSASDDGLPSGNLTLTWSRVSGPGTVFFGSSAAAISTATFSAAGNYVLRLTASDGTYSTSDDVSVSVTAATSVSGVVGYWKFDGSGADASGSGNTASLQGGATFGGGHSGSGLVMNGSNQFATVPDASSLDVSQAITISAWIKPQSRGTQYVVKKAGHSATDGFELSLSNKGTVFVRFNETSSGNSFRVDSSARYPTNGTWMHVVATYDGSTIRLYINGQEQGSKAAKFSIATNNLPLSIGAGADGYRPFSGTIDDVLIANRALSTSEISALYQGTFDPSPAPVVNQPPTVNAGADRSTQVGSAVTLGGSVSDDGLPSGSLSSAWSVVSGPGSVNFANAATPNTSASFAAAGTYVLRLTGSDGVLSASDDVVVTVAAAPVNGPPSVSAGPDVAATVGAPITLNGSASDDGLPSGNLTLTWSRVSGPGTVFFGSSGAATSTATFSAAGTYVLRLTGSDGVLSASDDVVVTVAAAPVNGPPSVSAGPDVAATVGTPITLNGSASDDGLPSGNLTLTWSRVSGPGTVFFGSSAAATSTATFSAAGTYVLRLTGSDGVLSASDDVVVAVAAPVNQPPTVNAGADHETRIGVAITLGGSASDDGLPSGALTTQWTVVSGPGTVNFNNSHSAVTTATFGSAGTYVLRLTASDGSLSASDDLTVSVATGPVLASGVAGYWNFDGSGADGSGNGNSATLQGGATLGGGHSGSGLTVNGSGQFATVPDSPSLEISQSITIAAWIKPSARGTQYVVKKAGHSSVDGFELSLSNKGTVFVRFNETSSGNTYRVDSSTNYPTNGNTWMYVVATYDGSTIRLYINGQEQASKAANFTIATNDLPLSIGAGADGYRAMSGTIDDVLIANRALSGSEILSLYQGDLI